MADYDVENIGSIPTDYEQIEKAIARVRFSEDATESSNIESPAETEESERITDSDSETILAKLSLVSDDSSISYSMPDDGRPLQKSATVAAVSDYAESESAADQPPDKLREKSKSSPEVLELTGYKTEMEKMLATHMDITHVLDRLYLSDFISLSASALSRLGVKLVINATYEIPNVDVPDGTVEFIKLNVNDAVTADIAQYMDMCADRVHEVRSAGGVALIHCALGISRSVTICLAYLVKYEGRTLREAYFELKKKRPIIRPNEGFWRQLIAFETAKRGRATVKLSVYPMGAIPDVYRSAPQTMKIRRYHVCTLETMHLCLFSLTFSFTFVVDSYKLHGGQACITTVTNGY